MKLLAPAKINLALDILKKDPLGYHEIQIVYHEIPELADEVEILDTEEKDNIHVDLTGVPSRGTAATATQVTTSTTTTAPATTQATPPPNIVYQALQLFKKTYKINKFVSIKITKNIPYSSGLGGASSDAAAILKGLNKLWNLNLSDQKLMSLAAELGMDVPFFIVGGTAFGTHFGEKITPLKQITIKFKINPATSNIPEKTKQAYSSLNLSLCGKNIKKTKALLEAIENSDNKAIITNLHNDFETLFPVKKSEHLSGAGPSTFTVI